MQKLNNFSANIEIYGDKVLRYLNHTIEQVNYEFIGFSDPKVIIIDKRKIGLDIFLKCVEKDDFSSFAEVFNSKAMVTLEEQEKEKTFILNEPENSTENRDLTFYSGMEGFLPGLDFEILEVNWLDDKKQKYAAITLS